MQSVVHPGPVGNERLQIALCSGEPFTVKLQAGIPLEQAVDEALSPLGFDSAWLELQQTSVEPVCYVIPDHASDNQHVAWYSEKYEFERGRIDRLGMIVGRYNERIFTHSHGQWTSSEGKQAMGHLLAPDTILATSATASGIGLKGATFDRRHDPETNFELFHIDKTDQIGGDYAAIRLLPNQDFATALHNACNRLGWTSARVHGIGSLIGACFEDGQTLNSVATEFLVTDCVIELQSYQPEIVIVGVEPDNILCGRLSRGKNAVLVTAEIVMQRLNR